MDLPGSDSYSSEALKTLKLAIFAHFSISTGAFLFCAIGLAVGFSKIATATIVAFVQAMSSLVGLVFCQHESTVALALLVAFQIVVGASEVFYAALLFLHVRIFVGSGMALLFFVQGAMIFMAMQKPRINLPKALVNLTEGLFDKPQHVDESYTPADMRSWSILNLDSAWSQFSSSVASLSNVSSLTFPPHQSRSDTSINTLQSNEGPNTRNAAGRERKTKAEHKKISSVTKPESKNSNAEKMKSLQRIVKESCVSATIDVDSSASSEQYLFERCPQAAELPRSCVQMAEKTANVLPIDICSAPKTVEANEKASYRLIHQAKRSAMVTVKTKPVEKAVDFSEDNKQRKG
ncbi:hypothetical protein QR680_005168 [Steinernema hermaphroditum]|uniref:Uncharacterized protein n=1 Tax=Steinernema hermaphroditum TaxID=289476 RepID=A0AA39HSH8_9BILA|nr:hypothetical protein QR680_005168 [Steinernema hermaphroditum]